MLMLTRSISVMVLSVTLASVAFAGAITYTFTTINDPSTIQSDGGEGAYGINSAGQIVGSYSNVFPLPPLSFGVGTGNGFLDNGGTFTTIDDPLGIASKGGTFATGINNAGEIVGAYLNASANPVGYHGFLDDNGTFTTINDPLGLNSTELSGINNEGEIVGDYNGGALLRNGFLYNGGTFTPVNDPLGVKGSNLRGINDSGQIVGDYFDASNTPHAFLDNGGAFSTISIPGATATTADAIDDAGQIAGWYEAGDADYGYLDSNGVITTINDPLGVGGTVAYGINNAGQIVGLYFDGLGNEYGYLATPDIQNISNLPGGPTSAPTYLLTGPPVAQVTGAIAGQGSQDYYSFYWAGGAFSATGSITGANAAGSYLFSEGVTGSCNNLGTVALNHTDNFDATIAIANLAPGDYCIGMEATSPNDPAFALTFNTPVTGVPEPSGFGLLSIGLGTIAVLRFTTRSPRAAV